MYLRCRGAVHPCVSMILFSPTTHHLCLCFRCGGCNEATHPRALHSRGWPSPRARITVAAVGSAFRPFPPAIQPARASRPPCSSPAAPFSVSLSCRGSTRSFSHPHTPPTIPRSKGILGTRALHAHSRSRDSEELWIPSRTIIIPHSMRIA